MLSLQLSVVIVNYKVKYFLEQSLYAVLRATEGIDAEVFVVDNASNDGSATFFKDRFPAVRFLWNKENAGFAKANNQVLHLLTGKITLFLNPDTIVREDSFFRCLEFFESHSDCGALGVKMIDGSGNFLKESKRGDPTPASSFYKISGLTAIFPTSPVFAAYYAAHLEENATSAVEVLPGAYFMVRTAILKQTGGFDERFFMYAEDIDLSLQIRQAGYRNYYFPEVEIVHFKGESTQKKSRHYHQQFYGAMRLFAQKHYATKPLSVFLMSLAIRGAQFLNYFGNLFSSVPIIDKKKSPLQTVVVGNSYAFNEALQLINFADQSFQVMGRVSVNTDDADPAIVDLENLIPWLAGKPVNCIVFCLGDLSYRAAISIMKYAGTHYSYFFHAAGSHSIVGSADKGVNGMQVAKQEVNL